MKNLLMRIAILFIVMISFTGCKLIADIFEAGVGFGIFITVAIVALVIYLIMRMLGGGGKGT